MVGGRFRPERVVGAALLLAGLTWLGGPWCLVAAGATVLACSVVESESVETVRWRARRAACRLRGHEWGAVPLHERRILGRGPTAECVRCGLVSHQAQPKGEAA